MKKTIAVAILACGFAAAVLAAPKSTDRKSESNLDTAQTRKQVMNNLQQIGVACHIFADVNSGKLPRQAANAKLSWRVQLLPFLEEAKLYEEFKQDEAWDSPHNKKLLARMPKIFMDPRMPTDKQAKGMTYFQAFASPGKGKNAILDNPQGLTLGAIASADGTSKTFLVVEAGEPEPWTKPSLLPCPIGKPLPKLGLKGDFIAVYCDGHVGRVPAQTPEKTIRALITYNGGERVEAP